MEGALAMIQEEIESIKAIYEDRMTWITPNLKEHGGSLDPSEDIIFSLSLVHGQSVKMSDDDKIVGSMVVRFSNWKEVYRPNYKIMAGKGRTSLCGGDIERIQRVVDEAIAMFGSNQEEMTLFVAYQAALDEVDVIMNHKKENADSCDGDNLMSNEAASTSHWVVLSIDHMRDHKQYMKSLSQWVKQLDLRGYLYHLLPVEVMVKGVYIILIGDEGACSEFQKRLRTQSIDVDSKGKPCKERMASNLFSGSYSCNITTLVVDRGCLISSGYAGKHGDNGSLFQQIKNNFISCNSLFIEDLQRIL